VQLDQTLLFAGSWRKLLVDDHRAGIAAGDTTPVTYTMDDVDASVPLKVTLVWTDFPGTPDSPPASAKLDAPDTWNAARLVNDLDLTVSGPGGTYLGNAFAAGVSTPGGSPDRRNNVEQVLIAAPARGTYTVTVRPNAIVEGPQDFAIVVTGAWGNDGGTPPPPPAVDASSPEGGAGAGGSGSGGTGGGAGGGGAGTAGSAGNDGGAGAGAAGSAGNGGGAGAGTAGSGGDATPPPGDTKDGCSCSIGRRAPVSATTFLALAAPLALLRSHRRFRRRHGRRA
jgi:hypothetical protein